MIDYLQGAVVSLSPTDVVIETGGIGFNLLISLSTFDAIQGCTQVRLLVHEQVREDGWTLYGFYDREERTLFKALIGVSGVGAQTARVMLSSNSPKELASLITSGDIGGLKRVKGIGARTAERIIVELRDKLDGLVGSTTAISTASAGTEEAVEALVALGFTRNTTEKAVTQVSRPGMSVEDLIRAALQELRS